MPNTDQNESGMQKDEANQMLRFLSGEMASAEQARFEQRLVAEPELSLALSGLIETEELIETLASTAEKSPAVSAMAASRPAARRAASVVRPRSPHSDSRSVFPIVAAVAACVLVAVVIAPQVGTSPPPTAVTAVEPIEPEQPAAFVDQWLEAIAASETELVEPEAEPIELAMLDPIDITESETGDVVPGWMYVAFEENETTGVTVE